MRKKGSLPTLALALLSVLLTLGASKGCDAQQATANQQQVFTNQTTAAYSSAVRNFNQASHWLFYCQGAGGAGLTGHVQLVGSYDSNPAHGVVISTIGYFGNSQCGLITAGGYYFAVFAQVFLDTGTGLSFNAYYSASTGAIAPSNVGLAAFPAIQCNNLVYTSSLTSSYTTLIAAPTAPFTHIFICSVSVDGNQVAGAGAEVFLHTSDFGIFFNHSLPTANSTFVWGTNTGAAFTADAAVQGLVSNLTGGTVSTVISYSYW